MRRELQDLGRRCGKNRLARLAKPVCGPGRSAVSAPAPLTAHPAHPVAENRLAQAPTPDRPGLVWQSDFTDLEPAEGWLFLAFTPDACTRRCVAHHGRLGYRSPADSENHLSYTATKP